MTDFIEKISDWAVRGWREHGILASVTIAQAIIESDWGRSELAKNANNLFGIKASHDWKGKKYDKLSAEYVDGKREMVLSSFRRYDSWEESVNDHSVFFTSTKWREGHYYNFRNATNWRDGAVELGKAGYATAPYYTNELLRIIEQYNLQKYDVIGEEQMNRLDITICLDGGHGGSDPGAVGFSLLEKEVNFNVTELLKAKLIARGFRVVVTRTGDEFVSLEQRANIANIADADLFVSTHCNAAANPNAYGFETFHYPTAVGGRKAANLVQESIQANTKLYQVGKPNVNRGTKTAHFTVLTNTAMEAILVEMAFITNREDNNILRAQQEGFAEAMCNAICKYFNIEDKAIEPELPIPSDSQLYDPVTLEGHWVKEEWEQLDEIFTVNGQSPLSEKRPDDPITRAEQVSLSLRVYKSLLNHLTEKKNNDIIKE